MFEKLMTGMSSHRKTVIRPRIACDRYSLSIQALTPPLKNMNCRDIERGFSFPLLKIPFIASMHCFQRSISPESIDFTALILFSEISSRS